MLVEKVKKFFKGAVADDEMTLKAYSKDASLFVVKPKLVVYPSDSQDIENLVKFVSEKKVEDQTLSITVRAAGSDMSGGPLNESIILDVTKHLNKLGEIKIDGTTVKPGLFYRDFEPKTLEKGLILPCFPASKKLATLGGMIGNNGAGEKTLRYGKMENFVKSSKYIFSDGKEYEVKPLSRTVLDTKMAQGGFEGNLYKQIFDLIEQNQEVIKAAKPQVSKNSAGYYL